MPICTPDSNNVLCVYVYECKGKIAWFVVTPEVYINNEQS